MMEWRSGAKERHGEECLGCCKATGREGRGRKELNEFDGGLLMRMFLHDSRDQLRLAARERSRGVPLLKRTVHAVAAEWREHPHTAQRWYAMLTGSA